MAMRGLRPIARSSIWTTSSTPADSCRMTSPPALPHQGRQKAPGSSAPAATGGGDLHSGSRWRASFTGAREYVCVRAHEQAAGFSNTLLCSDGRGAGRRGAERLRLKEKLPSNLGELTVPLGSELLREGRDVTLVTYGACFRIGPPRPPTSLARVGHRDRVIDVQTLLPFDRPGRIVESLKRRTASSSGRGRPRWRQRLHDAAVIEGQGGWAWLDPSPRTLRQGHRPPTARTATTGRSRAGSDLRAPSTS